MAKFFAVGWQAPKKQLVGQLDYFRQAHIGVGLEDYVAALQFSNTPPDVKGNTLVEKFNAAISCMRDIEVVGNYTESPFFRTLTRDLPIEYARYSKVTEQLSQELSPVADFEKIRLYIITHECNEVSYRFYIKALRTAMLNTRFVVSAKGKNIVITDTGENGKALPYFICYAERTEGDKIVQYVFSVQDYEEIFGIAESRLKLAKSNFSKFLSDGKNDPVYKISGEFTVSVQEGEKEKIESKINEKRMLANALSKYSNEANAYSWENVKAANALSKDFMQTPFNFDEGRKEILLSADSLEAWVSVITNAKKLAIASNNYEDRFSDKLINRTPDKVASE